MISATTALHIVPFMLTHLFDYYAFITAQEGDGKLG